MCGGRLAAGRTGRPGTCGRRRPWRALSALLSDGQKAAYEADGFLVLEDFATAADVRELRERGDELVRSFDPETISIFSTKKQEKTMNGKVSPPFSLSLSLVSQNPRSCQSESARALAIFTSHVVENHWYWLAP